MGTLRFEALAGSSPDTWMRSRHFGEFGLHQIGPGFLKIHTGYCCRASNPEGVILAAGWKSEMLWRKLLLPCGKSEMPRRKSLFPRGKSEMLRRRSLFPR